MRGLGGDQYGLVRPLDEVLVCFLSRMAEVHILCAAAGIGLKKIASPVRGDAHIMAQPSCKELGVNAVQHGSFLPCPSGKDIVVEVVGNGQCPAVVAGQICPSPWGKEDVPHSVNERALVGL